MALPNTRRSVSQSVEFEAKATISRADINNVVWDDYILDLRCEIESHLV